MSKKAKWAWPCKKKEINVKVCESHLQRNTDC